MSATKIAAIIPARMASTRYPGKPLIEIEGLPMIEHVRRRTLLCQGFSDVIVATCDKEIHGVVSKYEGKVVMTSDQHIMASDRVAEAALTLDCTHVVNVQGDEILGMPDDLDKMIRAIEQSPEIPFWNATARIKKEEELADSAIVKCVVSITEKILYCSRQFQHLQLKPPFEPVRKILGILGYRKEALIQFNRLPRTPLESTQSIDQSRIIENDSPLMSVPFASGYPGINDTREAEIVRGVLQSNNHQQMTQNHKQIRFGGVPEALGGGLGTILAPRGAPGVSQGRPEPKK